MWIGLSKKNKIYRYFEMSFSYFGPFRVWGVTIIVTNNKTKPLNSLSTVYFVRKKDMFVYILLLWKNLDQQCTYWCQQNVNSSFDWVLLFSLGILLAKTNPVSLSLGFIFSRYIFLQFIFLDMIFGFQVFVDRCYQLLQTGFCR